MTLPQRDAQRSREGAQLVQPPVRRLGLDVTRKLDQLRVIVEIGANGVKALNWFNRRSDGGRRTWTA